MFIALSAWHHSPTRQAWCSSQLILSVSKSPVLMLHSVWLWVQTRRDSRLVSSKLTCPPCPPPLVGTVTEDASVGHSATRKHRPCRLPRTKGGQEDISMRNCSPSLGKTHLLSQRVGAPLPGQWSLVSARASPSPVSSVHPSHFHGGHSGGGGGGRSFCVSTQRTVKIMTTYHS